MEHVWEILLIGTYIVSKVIGQDICTWSPPDLTGQTHAIGTDAEYFINSTTALRNFILYTWSYDSVTVSQHTYSSTGDGSFDLVSVGDNVETNAIKITEDLVLLSARVKAVTSSDNGKSLRVSRSSCDTGGLGATVTLTVIGCSNDPYGNVAKPIDFPSTCGLGCKVKFNCTTAACGTFDAECLADATWNITEAPCSSTCAVLPPNMVFTGGAANVGCGMTTNVTCNGPLAQVCNTFGKCIAQDNIVTLDDPTFSCTQVCPVTAFAKVANTSDSSPTCGGSVTFQCNGTSTCGKTIEFTRLCEKNGLWNESTDPCSPDCGLSGGAIAGIVIGVLVFFGVLVTIILFVTKSVCFAPMWG